MIVHAIERREFVEYYVTAGAPNELAKFVAERGIEPILERTYGAPGFDGRSAEGRELAGIQLWGLAPRRKGATMVKSVGTGRAWNASGARFFYLPLVRGAASTAPAQADRMFRDAEAALRAREFSYAHVVRTWIYLRRLLDWYVDFNRVRTACYRDFGLPSFPASTGIQVRTGEEECAMALLAVDGLEVRPVHRARQGEACAYGSAFSRATAVKQEGRMTVYISGTASIDAAGRSRHAGDAEAQSLETLLNVAAILEGLGGGLEHIVQATLFCKNRAAFEAYRRATRLLRVPELPIIAVLADICRPELHVELEAVAVLP